jgi:hypothetical protein
LYQCCSAIEWFSAFTSIEGKGKQQEAGEEFSSSSSSFFFLLLLSSFFFFLLFSKLLTPDS